MNPENDEHSGNEFISERDGLENCSDTISDREVNMGAEVPENIKKNRTWWVAAGILVFLLIIFIGAAWGYKNGISKRLKQEESIRLSRAAEQFELGVSDLEQGRSELAKERFEYVINLEPNYPEVAEKLREALLEIYTVATPTPIIPTATPTLIPTRDYRGAAELFDTAINLIIEKKWDDAIAAMDSLRQNYIEYKAVDVDGLYYISLRNRGIDKILYQGNLEPGIYDLSLAEKFAPLDSEADGYRTWARLYITGASYWDIDWGQVVYYFSQVQPAFPYLRDGSGMTSTDRYRIGLMRYADQLAIIGEWCTAKDYYDLAFSLGTDALAQPTATYIYEQCEAGAGPIETETPTPTPTEETPVPPTELPTEEPTQ